MAEQEQNRSEAATPHKIQEAKKRGSVAKSMEINSLGALLALLAILHLWGWDMVTRQLRASQRIFSQAHQITFDSNHFMAWLNGVLLDAVYMLVPLFITIALVGVITNIVQIGPIFTFFPLKPDFDRINPVSGFKRIFSLRLLVETLKTIIKLALFGAVLYGVIKHLLPDLIKLMHANPVGYGQVVLSQTASLIFKLVCIIAFIAMLDIIYTRWDFAKKLKMSRREVKEEVKRRDGDPRVKARIRELQRETLKRSKALNRVQDADVLITNPTHLAIAIKYVRSEMQAPEVLAKGAGELAGLMKDIARKHRVPIVENKKLARALFTQVGFEGTVPEKLFPDVARLLVWVYAIRERNNLGVLA